MDRDNWQVDGRYRDAIWKHTKGAWEVEVRPGGLFDGVRVPFGNVKASLPGLRKQAPQISEGLIFGFPRRSKSNGDRLGSGITRKDPDLV